MNIDYDIIQADLIKLCDSMKPDIDDMDLSHLSGHIAAIWAVKDDSKAATAALSRAIMMISAEIARQSLYKGYKNGLHDLAQSFKSKGGLSNDA